MADDVKQTGLTARVADKFGIDRVAFIKLLKTSYISVGRDEAPPTDEELAMLMLAIDRYDLDPNFGQVYAFRSQGKMRIMVGYDGWVSLATRQKGFKGVEYLTPIVNNPDGTVDPQLFKVDDDARPCWPWVRVVVRSEGRADTSKIVFLEEWYVPRRPNSKPGLWQTKTCHRFLQKAYTLGVREHFGLPFYDEADIDVLRAADDGDGKAAGGTRAELSKMAEDLRVKAGTADPPAENPEFAGAVVVEPEPAATASPGIPLDDVGSCGFCGAVVNRKTCGKVPEDGGALLYRCGTCEDAGRGDPPPTPAEPDDWDAMSGEDLAVAASRVCNKTLAQVRALKKLISAKKDEEIRAMARAAAVAS